MKSLNEFYQLLENFTNGVVVHDSSSAVLYSNHAALDFLGLTIEQIQGKKATDPRWHFIREDQSPMPIEEFPVQHVLTSGKPLKNLVLGVIRPDLQYPMWAICNSHPEFDQEGKLKQIIVNFTDITLQKKAEENLKEAAVLTKRMIDSMLDGFSVLDTNGIQIDANPAFCKMTGFSLNELVGSKPPYIYWPPEQYPNIQEAFTKTLNNHISDFELIFMRKNGERFPVIVAPSVVKDKHNNIIHYTATVKDISEFRKAESRANKYLEIAEVILVAFDENARITLLNRKGYEVLGYDIGELQGHDWFKTCIPTDEYDTVIEVYKKIKSGDLEPFKKYENDIITKTGERRHISWRNTLLKNESGKIIGTLSSGEDITERMKIENKLKETAEQLSRTYALAHIGVWSWHIETDKITWSDELYNISGVDPKLPLTTFAQLGKIHTPDSWERLQIAVEKALTQGIPYQLELEYILPDNLIRNVTAHGGVKRDRNGKIAELFGTVQDVTERSQLEKNLKAALESAKMSALVKSRFLDMAAHELRTPVSAFSLLLQFTQKKLEKGIPVDLATFERLRAQVERISRLVIELLDVSRLERGTLTLKPTLINLDSLILQCIEEFKLRESARNLIFVKSGSPIEIKIDATRIFQVLSNLIDNATKYTNANTPIEISVQRIAKKIRVSVKDYGQGISMQQQKDLFAPFTRGSSEQTEKAGGLGLGLFISREIIALHGGTIGVTSEIGVGSTFYFELPE
jgi:PAS domain S-box-containing protein